MEFAIPQWFVSHASQSHALFDEMLEVLTQREIYAMLWPLV